MQSQQRLTPIFDCPSVQCNGVCVIHRNGYDVICSNFSIDEEEYYDTCSICINISQDIFRCKYCDVHVKKV